jgi:AraC-like DNA-binding protein
MENQQQRFILALVAYAAQRDISPGQLCKLAGISLDNLKKNPKIAFTDKQLNDLWVNACFLGNDPLFGLHFGESLQFAALGVVGDMIKTSSTVGEALTHAAAMVHLITDLFHMKVVHSVRAFTVKLIPYPNKEKQGGVSFHQLMDFFMVFVIRELDGLVLEKIRPLSVKYPVALSDLAEFERVLRCRPVKRSDDYQIEFPIKYWNEPILTANYELQGALLQKINATGKEFENTQALQARIYNYLLANSYLGVCSLEDIAANFNVSPRNLQRKLRDEGVKYQELADAVKKSLAIHYLGSGNYRIKDISHMLGYNELSAFTRAFKRWTGASPMNYASAPPVH